MIFPEGVLSVETEADRRAIARAAMTEERDFDLSSPHVRAFLFGEQVVSGPSILSTAEIWRSSPTVRSCVEAIAMTLSQLPFKMYRQKGDTYDEVTKHALLYLMARPNRELGIDTSTLLLQTFAVRELFGEAFWILERAVPGRAGSPVKAIWLWHPALVEEIVDQASTKKLLAWKVSFEGKSETLDPLDVVHFPRFDPLYINPKRPSRGRPALGSAMLTVSADIAAQKYNLGFFDRGATPDGVYQTDSDIDTDVEDRILDRVKAKLAHKSHEPIVLSNGLKFQPTHTTPRDAEFVGGRKMNREEILMAFHVPPVAIGILEYASYNNASEQLRLWWDLSLKPIIQSFCGAVKARLIPEPDIVCELSTEKVQVLQKDVHKAIESGAKLFSLGVPWNMIDGLLDIGTGPVAGGDVGYLPLGLVPVEQLGDASEDLLGGKDAAPAAQPTVDPKPAEPVAPVVTLNGAQIASILEALVQVAQGIIAPEVAVGVLVFAGIPRPEAESMVAAQGKIELPAPSDTTAEPAAIAMENAKALLRAFQAREEREASRIVVPTAAELDRFSRAVMNPSRAASEDALRKLLTKLIKAIRDTDGDLTDRTRKLYEKAFSTGAEQMGSLIGAGVTFGLDDPAALEFISQKLIEIKGINDSTVKKIRTSVARAIDEGKSVDDFADDLRGSFNFSTKRARLIARTEISQTVNGGRYAVLESEGTERHEWLDSNDDRVRDTHTREDGHIVAVGDTFPVTGLLYPGDPEGEPSEIISCRCVSLPAVSNRALAGDARRDYWRGAVAEWAPIETKFWKAIKRTLHEQRSAVLEIIANTKE